MLGGGGKRLPECRKGGASLLIITQISLFTMIAMRFVLSALFAALLTSCSDVSCSDVASDAITVNAVVLDVKRSEDIYDAHVSQSF